MERFIDTVILVTSTPSEDGARTAAEKASAMARLISGALTVKGMVSGRKKVNFVRFCTDTLWYVTEDGFEFPVPVSDVGTATMLAQDRAMLFMRYINRHLNMLKDVWKASELSELSGLSKAG